MLDPTYIWNIALHQAYVELIQSILIAVFFICIGILSFVYKYKLKRNNDDYSSDNVVLLEFIGFTCIFAGILALLLILPQLTNMEYQAIKVVMHLSNL